jgi:hypothetical protein
MRCLGKSVFAVCVICVLLVCTNSALLSSNSPQSASSGAGTQPQVVNPSIEGDSDVSAFAGSGKTVTPVPNGSNLLTTDASPNLVIGSDIATYPLPGSGGFIRLEFHGIGYTAATRIRIAQNSLDNIGTEIASLAASDNILIGTWLARQRGTYLIWAQDDTQRSNIVTIIVGSAAKTTPCTGGILPFTTSTDEVALYKTKFDVLNCIYQAPPPGANQ